MRIGVQLGYAGDALATAAHARDLEAAGADLLTCSEVYTFDAVSRLGYLAAVTGRVGLMSSILPIYGRTPALTAMTAAGLDDVSGGRFTLGLGASGPQVVEGWHGVPYDAPLQRTREVVEICRMVWRRERLVHDGPAYPVPLPPGQGTGLGKPLKLVNTPVRERIPVSLAAIGPRNVELAAEIAEGWQPAFFHPGRATQVWGQALAAGRARRAADLGELDVAVAVAAAVTADRAATGRSLDAVRPGLALYLGGMGARGRNFYHDLACRYGFRAEADAVQEHYLAGRLAQAAAAVPDELVRAVSLVGEPAQVAEAIAAMAAAGVTTLLLQPLDDTPAGRVATVEAVRALVPVG